MTSTGRIVPLVAALSTFGVGCFEFGLDRSAQENRRSAGRSERGYTTGSFGSRPNTGWGPASGSPTGGGVEYDDSDGAILPPVRYSSVVLTPDGEQVVTSVATWLFGVPVLVPALQRLDGTKATLFPELFDARRVNMSRDGATLFVLSSSGFKVTAIDLGTHEVVGDYTSPLAHTVLDVSPDGRLLVLSSIVTSDLDEWLGGASGGAVGQQSIVVLDVDTGKSTLVFSPRPIRDLDFSTAHPGELILTSFEFAVDGSPAAHAVFVDARTGETRADVVMPNCADELVLQPGGVLALLSPTVCRDRQAASADPISVLDTAARVFITNLPGFGPVAMAPDGSRALGFTRQADMASQWGYAQREVVGLISVELPSLAWTVHEYGPKEPTYTLVDGGRQALVHEADGYDCQDGECAVVLPRLELFDLTRGGRRTVSGVLGARLERFAADEQGHTLWFPDRHGGVLELDVLGGHIAAMKGTWTGSPELLARPRRGREGTGGPLLVLGEEEAARFYVVGPFGSRTVTLE